MQDRQDGQDGQDGRDGRSMRWWCPASAGPRDTWWSVGSHQLSVNVRHCCRPPRIVKRTESSSSCFRVSFFVA